VTFLSKPATVDVHQRESGGIKGSYFVGALFRAYNYLLHGLAVLSGILIFFVFVLIVVDVTIRTLGMIPPPFTLSVVEYVLLWFTMLAAPWLVRIKGHVFIDAVTQFLPGPVKLVVAKIVYAGSAIATAIYASRSFELLQTSWIENKVDVRSIDMPQWTLFAPMPLCFAMVSIEFIRYLVGIDDMYSQTVEEREGV
jgi:C4-dicarboxylate transporter DctQ subunit